MIPIIVLNDDTRVKNYVTEVEGETPSPAKVGEKLRELVKEGAEDPTSTTLEILGIERHPHSVERE